MSAYGGRGPEIVGVSWALTGTTTVIIWLRTYVRFAMNRRTGAGYSWDLWWAYLAWTLGIFGMSFISASVHYGFGNHLDIVIERGDIEKAALYEWIWATFSTMMTAIAKFSVVAFLLNVQGPTHPVSRYIMYVLVSVSFAANFATVFLIWFQCDPPSKLWQPETPGSCGGAQANFNVSTFSGSWGAVTDFYLAVYPVVLIYRLPISKRLKALLCCLMGLGLFTAVCSIVKTYELHVVTESTDPTYEATPLILWGIAESWVMLIASGIPAIWPLIKKFLEKLNLSARLQMVTTILLRSLLSSRGSGSGRNGSGGSNNSALARQAEQDELQSVPTTQTRAFARLGSSSDLNPSIPKNAVVVTQGFDVQEEDAPPGTWNTYGLPDMQPKATRGGNRH